jgi:hypothetical protein
MNKCSFIFSFSEQNTVKIHYYVMLSCLLVIRIICHTQPNFQLEISTCEMVYSLVQCIFLPVNETSLFTGSCVKFLHKYGIS